MTDRVEIAGLQIARELHDFVAGEVVAETGIDAEEFWTGFATIVADLGPKNRALLARRDELQAKIDAWHRDNGAPSDMEAYKGFLKEIGYLVPEGAAFTVATANVDPEIAKIAGPQLVVPVMNARYALNAANARWGWLYDALYGTDAIPETGGAENGKGYNPVRGEKVIAWARDFLDEAAPLDGASWQRRARLLRSRTASSWSRWPAAERPASKQPEKFAGYLGDEAAPTQFLLTQQRHPYRGADRRDLADRQGRSGAYLGRLAGIGADDDHGLRGFDRRGRRRGQGRRLPQLARPDEGRPDRGGRQGRQDLHPQAQSRPRLHRAGRFDLRRSNCRSLMLVRNVGHLMTNPAILDGDGKEVPEGIMDAMVTALIALHDVGAERPPQELAAPARSMSSSRRCTARTRSPSPSRFSRASRSCSALAPQHDQDGHHGRGAAHDAQPQGVHPRREGPRLLHQHRLPRPHRRRDPHLDGSRADDPQGRHEGRPPGFPAYEAWNVDIGLVCGLPGHAQIGKGMWAMPDLMAAMLEQKIGHPEGRRQHRLGALADRRDAACAALSQGRRACGAGELKAAARRKLDDILSIPVAERPNWTPEEIQQELDNNAQGILGYVVRWIDQGVGCSKVPDINDVGLMEDRATLRISSQHIANWLHHGVCTRAQVMETLKRMAAVVDRQNAGDPLYRPMAAEFDGSIAFQAACDLVFKGREQPNGYTEPILHARRLELKARGQGEASSSHCGCGSCAGSREKQRAACEAAFAVGISHDPPRHRHRQALRRLRLRQQAGAELGRAVLDIGKGHAEHLMAVIEDAMSRPGSAYADLGAIAVSVGPGSFTGVRVGVSAARGLRMALKIPAIGVTTLEALAAEARERFGARTVLSALDAGRERDPRRHLR